MQVTFGYVHPGEVFGECAIFDDRPRESFAAAHEPSTVLVVSRERFASAMQSSATVMFSLAKQIEGRFKVVESRLEDLVFRNARSRLAHILLQLCREFGHLDGSHTHLEIRLTHEEIGTLIGASRPTVTLALGELEADGVVRRVGRFIDVDDIGALETLAQQGAGGR